MNEELNTLWMSMKGDFGPMLCVSSWRFAMSLTYGVVAKAVASLIEQAIPEDAEWIKALFNHRAYRIFVLLFKVATSIELPKLARKPTGDTAIFGKPL